MKNNSLKNSAITIKNKQNSIDRMKPKKRKNLLL